MRSLKKIHYQKLEDSYTGTEKGLTPEENNAFLSSLICTIRSTRIKQGLLQQLKAVVDLESHL